MDIDRMRHLLTDWGVWASDEGTQRRAKTTSTLAENIGAGSYGSDHVPAGVDLEILKVDDLIKRLPRVLYEAIRIAYKTPGPLKAKLRGVTRTAHNERVKAAQIALIDMWDEPSDKASGNRTIANMGMV